MTLAELRQQLGAIPEEGEDPEYNHVLADKLLLEYIDDKAVTDSFNSLDKWYA